MTKPWSMSLTDTIYAYRVRGKREGERYRELSFAPPAGGCGGNNSLDVSCIHSSPPPNNQPTNPLLIPLSHCIAHYIWQQMTPAAVMMVEFSKPFRCSTSHDFCTKKYRRNCAEVCKVGRIRQSDSPVCCVQCVVMRRECTSVGISVSAIGVLLPLLCFCFDGFFLTAVGKRQTGHTRNQRII